MEGIILEGILSGESSIGAGYDESLLEIRDDYLNIYKGHNKRGSYDSHVNDESPFDDLFIPIE